MALVTRGFGSMYRGPEVLLGANLLTYCSYRCCGLDGQRKYMLMSVRIQAGRKYRP